MKTISAPLQAHLDGELTTLTHLVKMTRMDGVIKAFTTHDVDIVLDGVTYKADGSFSIETLDGAAGLKAGTGNIAGILDSAILSEDDIKAGVYDHARVDVFMCNWVDTTQGAVPIRRGWLGEIALIGGKYVAELRGLRDVLQRPVGSVYTPECRHDLGSAACGVDVESLTVTGSVTSVVDNQTFGDYIRSEPEDTFNYGKLTWTSGANAGLSMEVQKWDAANQVFTLWLPMPHVISVGDDYSVYPGCDKRFTTCRTVFANTVNFGGFPHVPGVGKVLKYAGG